MYKTIFDSFEGPCTLNFSKGASLVSFECENHVNEYEIDERL